MKHLLKTGLVITFAAAALLLGNVEPNGAIKSKKTTSVPQQLLSFPFALADSDETLLQTIRVFYRLGMGMTQADYNALKADKPKIVNLTGVDGIVGKLDTLRRTVANSVIANNPSISDCEDVPATGQFTDGNMTIKFATPKNKAPGSFPNGGGDEYEKRLEIVQVNGTKTTTSVFEFNCGVAASMLVYKFVDTADTSLNHKVAFFYDGEDSEDKHFQFFFDWPSEDVHMAVVMEIEEDLFRSWISSGKEDGDTGYRMAAIGHLDTGKVSFFADDTTGEISSGRTEHTTVTSDNAPKDGVPYQACADGFDDDYEEMEENDLCGNDDLSEFIPANLGLGLANLSTKEVHDHVETEIDSLLQ